MTGAFADAARGAHYASAILLFGCFVFQLAVAEPALRAAGAGVDERRHLEGLLRPVAAASLASTLLTGLVWLWLNTADMSGETLAAALSWQLIGTVLGETGFGVLWQFRGAVATLLGALLLLPLLDRRIDKTSAGRLVFLSAGGLLSGIILASLALAGHGADDSGTARTWHLGADLLHLLAAGAWLGSLPLLVLTLWHAREPGAFIRLRIAQAATPRFSILGLVTVATLIVTGSINTWYLVGSVPALVGTPYGRVLLVKLALFAGMLALAAVNRLKLTPLILALPAEPMVIPQPVRRLYQTAMFETALAIPLLFAVGSLGHLVPGAHTDAVWPFPFTLDVYELTHLSSTRLALLAVGFCAVLGFAVAAISLRRRRSRFAAASIAAVAAVGAFGLGPFIVDAFPTSYARSPLRYDTLSIARGMSIYAQNCVACHGSYGYGDGPMAASLPVRPADLTRAHFYRHSEGSLFWWVSYGVVGSAMPGFADRLSETQRWEVIALLRAQADAEGAKFMAADIEPRGPVVAPDFAFQIGHAHQETLREQRDRFAVLLVLFHDAGSLPRLRELDAATAQLERAGVRVIALPMTEHADASDKPELALSHLSIAEADPETIATYSLFRRTPSVEGIQAMPAHMEFLIDRQGYLRYRWSPAYGTRWSRMTDLLKRIDSLREEPAPPPTPERHLH